MSLRSRRLLLVVAALLGIVFAIGVTWATSRIVNQRIGLSSEPVTAGLRLVPARRRPRTPAQTSTATTPAPAPRSTSTEAAPPAPAATAPEARETPPAVETARPAEPAAREPSRGGSHERADHAASGDD